MKPPRWTQWTLAATFLLPLSPNILKGQQYEQSVTASAISGQLVFAGEDEPAEQVRIQLLSATSQPVASTVTGWGGEFRFSNLVPGDYVISIDRLGFQPLLEKVHASLSLESITLRLSRTSSVDSTGHEEIVSVRQLGIPAKAREALRNGIKLLQMDDLPGGLASFQYAISVFPGYYEAFYLLGVTNLMLDRAENAEQAFRRSVELSEGHYARSLLALGAILCDQEKFSEAESVIREGLDLDDTPWIGHYSLARALFNLGDLENAEKSVKASIERRPDIPDAYLLLANIHIRLNNNPALLDDLDEFLKLEPNGAVSARAIQMREDLWRTIGHSRRAATLNHP